MNENVNSPVKWLQYLLYVGIAAAVNSYLVNSLLGGLSRWLGLALSGAAVYLMYRLIDSNARYQKAALFSGVALVSNLLGIQMLSLVGSICSIVAQYQEYHAHSELVAERDSRLAGKWNNLFWLEFAVELILGLLISLVAVSMVAAEGLDAVPVTAIATVAATIVATILRVLYLVYLHRTIKALETEFVMEDAKE